jgi:hypothetical protein
MHKLVLSSAAALVWMHVFHQLENFDLQLEYFVPVKTTVVIFHEILNPVDHSRLNENSRMNDIYDQRGKSSL